MIMYWYQFHYEQWITYYIPGAEILVSIPLPNECWMLIPRFTYEGTEYL
jgi:hypothetical protein